METLLPGAVLSLCMNQSEEGQAGRDGSSRDKNNNTDSLMHVISTDVAPLVQHKISVPPRREQTARNVGCQTEAVYVLKDSAEQCNMEITSR